MLFRLLIPFYLILGFTLITPQTKAEIIYQDGLGLDTFEPIKALKTSKLKPLAKLRPLPTPKLKTTIQSAYKAPKPVASISGCTVWHSGNLTIDTLINRESGGRTCATNAGGCYGILQACPGYPLRVACGGDGACQLAWFTANKLGRYGSWGAALAHSYQFGWW